MPMTIVVTRDVEDRYRGFLSSVMLELAPGVYTGPRMSRGVRERVWHVLSDWHATLGRGAVLMTWRETAGPWRPSRAKRWANPGVIWWMLTASYSSGASGAEVFPACFL